VLDGAGASEALDKRNGGRLELRGLAVFLRELDIFLVAAERISVRRRIFLGVWRQRWVFCACWFCWVWCCIWCRNGFDLK